MVLNTLVYVCLIPVIVLGSVVLSRYMTKKIQPPYKASPSFLDQLEKNKLGIKELTDN